MKRSLRERARAAVVVVAVAGMGVFAASAASAVPAPDSGPVAGGTTVQVTVPGVTFTQVSGGSDHSVAIGSDGLTYAWGDNSVGQLGDGTTTNRSNPVLVQTPAGVTFTQVEAGGGFAFAVGSDGLTYAWGDNTFGQLGDGTTTSRLTPVVVQTPGGVTFTQITGGYAQAVAVGSDGLTYAWGRNSDGQLGDGTTTDSSTPVLVQAPVGVTFTQITTGNHHSVAVGSDGLTYAWGYNLYGQLGDGTTTDSSTPVLVQTPVGVTFTQITNGSLHSVAVGSDGLIYAWGRNSDGQLGDGTTTNRLTPVLVQTPGGVTFTQIAAGYAHSVAVGSDGLTYAWGDNVDRQLGDGTATNRPTPVLVQTPAGVTFTQISGRLFHSVAVGSDGLTYAWGANGLGQLGDGTKLVRSTPVLVRTPVGVVTGVTFGGVQGTDVTNLGGGLLSVVTPAHAACGVDVVVSWTLNGAVQTPVTYPNGFNYTDIPVVTTAPVDQSVVAGADASFTVAASGCPAVTSLEWEISTDEGSTWAPASSDPAVTVSADGVTLSYQNAQLASSGHLFRAVATNNIGAVTSTNARLTVTTEPSPTVPPTDPVTPAPSVSSVPTSGDGLAATGASSVQLVSIAGAVMVLLGSAIAFRARSARATR